MVVEPARVRIEGRMSIQVLGESAAYCPHGAAPYIRCPKCAEIRRQEKREEALYATLDKLADAINALAAARAA